MIKRFLIWWVKEWRVSLSRKPLTNEDFRTAAWILFTALIVLALFSVMVVGMVLVTHGWIFPLLCIPALIYYGLYRMLKWAAKDLEK